MPACFACSCGAVAGAVRIDPADPPERVVCYCDDCRAFARLCGADALLDVAGGTEIVQLSPAALTLERGGGRLACIRLSAKGLLRWRASCCGAPLANTPPQRGVAFVGVIAERIEDREAFGPIGDRVFGAFAIGPGAPPDAHPSAPARLYAKTAWTLLRRRLRGDHLATPFFERESGAPVAEPEIVAPQ